MAGSARARSKPQGLEDASIERQIRERAHQLYILRGEEPGSELEDWLQAEREVLAEREAAIDEASEESFPASDPPAR